MSRWILALALLVPLRAFADETANPIDRYFEKQWKEKGVTLAARSSDDEFLRRATLDILGRPPRPAEVHAFEKSRDRDVKIDELLASEEAADFFADEWLGILIDDRFDETLPLRVNVSLFRGFLKKAWQDDVPYSQLVSELVSASGDATKHPAANYLLAALDPKEPPYELASRTARIFLGKQIQCARCHDHPYDKLSQKDFWAFTAFFSGTTSKARTTFDGYGVKVTDEPARAIKIPDTETEVAPRFLDGNAPEPSKRPREELARFVTSSPRLARALVNRVWTHFMGRGFYAAVDRVAGTCEHEPLLDALCAEFTDAKTSLHHLARTIVRSRAYQLSCEGDPADYGAMALKPQSPVQLLNTLTWALGLDVFLKQLYEQFLGNKALPEQYRQDAVFRRYLVEYVRKLDQGGGVRLALKLANGKDLQGLVNINWGRLKEIAAETRGENERLGAIFVTLLGRAPTAEETARYRAYLEKRHFTDRAWEDVYWTVLNSTELLFNH